MFMIGRRIYGADDPARPDLVRFGVEDGLDQHQFPRAGYDMNPSLNTG
jgi:hypothetical protein